MSKDLYQVLGLSPESSPSEIKTAYRKLALKFHPDLNSNDKYFEQLFKEVQQAYEVLSHPVSRKEYDLKAEFAQRTQSESSSRVHTHDLADHVEQIYRKIKFLSLDDINKNQLIAVFDTVLNDTLIAEFIKDGNNSRDERIISCMVSMFKFLSTNEINRYRVSLVRLADGNAQLIARIHREARSRIRERNLDKLSTVVRWTFVSVVSGFLIFAFLHEDSTSTPSRSSTPIVDSQRPELAKPVSKYQGNQLQTGDSPYNHFFGAGVYNQAFLNQLQIKNGQGLDVIVCLTELSSSRVIRNEYIRAGDSFLMTSIPNGIYYLKSFYGKDWNPDTVLYQGRLRGYFNTSSDFKKSADHADLIRMEQSADEYSIYAVTLYRVPGGNMESTGISSNEFFR